MSYLIKPQNYKPLLDLKQTELGIKQIKEFFQLNLSSEQHLRRVTAPLFVLKGMGINDDLNGIERPVSFPIHQRASGCNATVRTPCLSPKSHKLQVNGNSTVIFLCTCISTARFSKAQASYITFVFSAR